MIDSVEPNSTSKNWELDLEPESGGHYYFMKVTEADENMLWSAPIRVTVK